jgi:hypothetical protein
LTDIAQVPHMPTRHEQRGRLEPAEFVRVDQCEQGVQHLRARDDHHQASLRACERGTKSGLRLACRASAHATIDFERTNGRAAAGERCSQQVTPACALDQQHALARHVLQRRQREQSLGVGRLGSRYDRDAALLQRALRRTTDRRRRTEDEIVRIAYLSGTPTHKRDVAEAEAAIEWALETYPQVRLVTVGHIDVARRFERFEGRLEHLGAASGAGERLGHRLAVRGRLLLDLGKLLLGGLALLHLEVEPTAECRSEQDHLDDEQGEYLLESGHEPPPTMKARCWPMPAPSRR